MDQRGFLARDIRTGTLHDLHLEARCGAVQVAPQVTGRGGFCRGCIQSLQRRWVFGSHVHVSAFRANRVCGVRQPGEHSVRILLHQHAVTERARVALVPVADHISRHRASRCGRPLCSDWIPGTSPTPQSRGRQLVDKSLRRPRREDLRPVLPRIFSGDNASEHHGLGDRYNGMEARRSPAGQLLGQWLGRRAAPSRLTARALRSSSQCSAPPAAIRTRPRGRHQLRRRVPAQHQQRAGRHRLRNMLCPRRHGRAGCPPGLRQIVVEGRGSVHRCQRDMQLGGRGTLVSACDTAGSSSDILQSFDGSSCDGHVRLLLTVGSVPLLPTAPCPTLGSEVTDGLEPSYWELRPNRRIRPARDAGTPAR